jgi:hypothetical protein
MTVTIYLSPEALEALRETHSLTDPEAIATWVADQAAYTLQEEHDLPDDCVVCVVPDDEEEE